VREASVTDDVVLERVLRIVVQIAGPGRTPPDAGPDTPLRKDGFYLDSIDLIELIVACEQEFGVIFAGESDLTPEALATSRRFAALIGGKGGR
jgi:acyl carrier protein